MSEDNFLKYTSINNVELSSLINSIKLEGFSNIKYMITEKVHGANSSILFNGTEFKYSTRTHYVGNLDNFYNLQTATEYIKPSLIKIFQILKNENCKLEFVRIFGEICGGNYPSKEINIKKNSQCKQVQKGVYYTPMNEFLAFDIAFKYETQEKMQYMCAREAFNFFEDEGIKHVPVLSVVNNLTEALEFPNDKESVVYNLFNLPKIEENIMEGVVIKPLDYSAYTKRGTRVILKNKNEKFKEKSREGKVNIKLNTELPENILNIFTEISKYINSNRVSSVASKMGELSIDKIGELIKDTCNDVYNEYNKYNSNFLDLAKSEKKIISKRVGQEVAKEVKKYIFENAIA